MFVKSLVVLDSLPMTQLHFPDCQLNIVGDSVIYLPCTYSCRYILTNHYWNLETSHYCKDKYCYKKVVDFNLKGLIWHLLEWLPVLKNSNISERPADVHGIFYASEMTKPITSHPAGVEASSSGWSLWGTGWSSPLLRQKPRKSSISKCKISGQCSVILVLANK